MLSDAGCRQRRLRFWQQLDPQPTEDYLVLSDPLCLTYLANFFVDPISSAANFGGYLLLRPNGHATLFHDNRLPRSALQAHVDERRIISWYDGQSPGRGPRQLVLRDAICLGSSDFHVHDQANDAYAPTVHRCLASMRRRKDPDELAVLRQCMTATEAGHAWARTHIQPGMTELDVYNGVVKACLQSAGQPVVVYGDFAVATGPAHHGGGPTERVLQPGDMFILDYSVVIGGYRSDFTNTLVIGREPTAQQFRLYELCTAAMAAGEKLLRAETSCLAVYEAVNDVFEKARMAEHFPHHAGHGLGLMHPEAPYLVRHANETLLAGDVITLEPGLYVEGIGGLRIENNYLITIKGYERLSNHTIALK